MLPAIKRHLHVSPVFSQAVSKVKSQKSQPTVINSEASPIVEEEEESPEKMKIPEKWNSVLNKKMEVWHDNFKADISYQEQFLDRQNYKFANKLHSSV